MNTANILWVRVEKALLTTEGLLTRSLNLLALKFDAIDTAHSKRTHWIGIEECALVRMDSNKEPHSAGRRYSLQKTQRIPLHLDRILLLLQTLVCKSKHSRTNLNEKGRDT